MELMFQPFMKYADFDGRARRAEYWLFRAAGDWPDRRLRVRCRLWRAQSSESVSNIGATGTVALLLLSLCPGLAVRIRRLHDINQSGWLIFLGVIPVLGFLALLILACIDGTSDRNRYGKDPKGRGARSATSTAAEFA